MDNQLLKIATIVARVVKLLLYGIIAILVITSIYLLVAKEPAMIDWLSISENGMTLSTETEEGLDVVDVNPWGFILNTILMIVKVVLVIIMLDQALLVINSIKSLETFQKQNVAAFRRIGQMFIGLFLVGILGVQFIDTGYHVSFHFNFVPLLGTLAAYILAEIFKEGNRLMEENKLTI